MRVDDAADATDDDAAVMAVVQRPLAVANFTGVEGEPAWKELPSWYLLCTEARMIPRSPRRRRWRAA